MENLIQSIVALQRRLSNSDIPSIVIGGVAVAAWGDPRVTRDVDLKVRLERDEADRLLAVLSPDYKSLLPDPRQALKKQAMVFVQDPAGTRLDLLLADTPYDMAAIERGRDVELQPGATVRMCSPEDLVIYKLVSTRPRDREDAQGVIRRQGGNLDDAYVLDWLRQFERALDDSTLVAEYKRLRDAFK
jgi:hypothetical protein